MAYQALYRVWRSQRFEDIVGQQAITQTLKNAIAQKKTSHAYLFTGPRGTGKTSAAKIFAKAINCPHSSEGEPCNACATCIAITEGRLNDVIEIDAASNNGVEEIRDIRDKVKYAPTEAMYKVYIIDEVHMLSAGAFNALLKTLEEPPANVVFILATTEPHKIPLTIISRTQRFDFKRIPTQAIVQHMSDILKKSGIEYEDEALFVIARAAEGGMRDALSILDQSLSFSDGVIRKKDAIQVTGSLTNEMMDSYLNSCFSHHVEEALGILEGLLNEGKEAHRFLEDLLLYCRDLLMFQQAPQIVIEKTGAMTDKFKELATTTDPVTIYEYIEAFNDTQNQIRFTNNPNVYLEVVTVKLASSTEKVIQNSSVVSDGSSSLQIDSTALEDLNQQIKTLQKQVKEIQKQGITNSPSEGANGASDTIQRKVQNTKTTFRVPSERVYQVLQEATKDNLLKVKEVWADLLSMLSVTQRAMLKASDIVAAGPERMVLAFDYEIVCQRATDDKDLQEAVQTGLARLIQYEPEMVCIPVEHWGSLRKTYLSEHQLQARASEENTDEPKIEMELVPEDIKKEDLVVDEAFAIFGEDVVKVVND